MTSTPQEDEVKEFGKRVKFFRKKLKLTQDELAVKANLSTQHIGEIERGQTNPTLECISRIAHGLGMSISCLFTPPKDQDMSVEEMKEILSSFISTAKDDQTKMFYMFYKGLM